MKKILSIALTFTIGFTFAQAPIINGGLESWVTVGTAPDTYEEPTGGMLETLNQLYDLGVPLTCYKSLESHTGTYAARIISHQTTLLGSLFVPGVIGTLKPIISPPNAALGYPYTEKPSSLSGWYKYTSVQNDSAEFFSYLVKRNGAVRDTIARASHRIIGSVPNYTFFDAYYIYDAVNGTMTPDSIIIVAVSSKGYNFSDLLQCKGKQNSTLWVDDLQLGFPSGLNESVLNGEELSVFPNPAKDVLNLSYTQNLTKGRIEILDLSGRIIKEIPAIGQNWTIDLSVMPAGIYTIRLINDNAILARRKFEKI